MGHVRADGYSERVPVALLGPDDELARRELPTGVISAALLFGSRARGDFTEHSDLDVLIVCSRDTRRTNAFALKRLGARPVIHTWATLQRLVDSDWLFAYHLWKEGKPLWDPDERLMEVLRPVTPEDPVIRTQILLHHDELDRYANTNRWGGDTMFPLAHLFRVTKRVCMLANARHRLYIFNRRAALATCADLFPKAAEPIRCLSALEPWYLETLGRRSADGRRGAADSGRLAQSVVAAKSLIEYVSR